MAISLKEFHSSAYEPHTAAELRLLYQLYEEAQRGRIAHGERLRAILQGRSVAIEPRSTTDANPLLKAIARGGTAGAPASFGPRNLYFTHGQLPSKASSKNH